MGLHLLIDLSGVEAEVLSDPALIEAVCKEAAIATGATVLATNFHHFGEHEGVSGMVLLAESHLSVHTWPEFGLGTFDVYVCGDAKPDLAVPVLAERLSPTTVKVERHKRGVLG